MGQGKHKEPLTSRLYLKGTKLLKSLIPGLLKEKSNDVLCCADSQKPSWMVGLRAGGCVSTVFIESYLSSAVLQVGGVRKRGIVIAHAQVPTEMPTLTPSCSHTAYVQPAKEVLFSFPFHTHPLEFTPTPPMKERSAMAGFHMIL